LAATRESFCAFAMRWLLRELLLWRPAAGVRALATSGGRCVPVLHAHGAGNRLVRVQRVALLVDVLVNVACLR
jgi:hypothetical protein